MVAVSCLLRPRARQEIASLFRVMSHLRLAPVDAREYVVLSQLQRIVEDYHRLEIDRDKWPSRLEIIAYRDTLFSY
jgi:hypothetical protein